MNNLDKLALIDGSATIQTKIKILPNNSSEEEIVLTEEYGIKDWEYHDFRYVPDEGIIGQFVARTLDGNVFSEDDWLVMQNHRIQLELGIRRMVNDEYVTTYYSYGTFIVEAPDDNNVSGNTKFESTDLTMLFNTRFDGDFTSSKFTESFNTIIDAGRSVTALWLAQYTCEQAGVELGSTTFRNSNFTITSNQYQGAETLRDVMKDIGKLAYSWVRIDWNDKVYLDFNVQTQVTDTYNNITSDHYYTLVKQADDYAPRNTVTLASSVIDGDYLSIQNESDVSENGIHAITIFDNYLTETDEQKSRALQSGSALYGFTYAVVDLETIGHPWLKGNELISIKTMENDTIYTYPFDRAIKYTGHIKTQLSSYSNDDIGNRLSYQGVESEVGAKKTARIERDRANAEIRLIAEIANDANNKAGTVLQQLSDKVSISVYNTEIQNLTNSTEELAEQAFNTATILNQMTASFTTKGLTITNENDEATSTLSNEGLDVFVNNDLATVVNKNGTGVNKLIAIESMQQGHIKMSTDTNGKVTRKHGTLSVISVEDWLEDLVANIEDLKED